MKFDIKKFYEQHHIEYITHGTNCKRGEINISCVFCNSEGNPDPSYHLGVDPRTGYWSCWRNRKRHRGRRLHRLIMKLARCTYQRACEILGDKVVWVEEGSFESFIGNPDTFFDKKASKTAPKSLEWPKEFVKFQGFRSGKRFENYLLSRGFRQNHLKSLTDQYQIHYCISGNYSDRLIIPVHLDYQLISWTSRTIKTNTTLRYLSLSEKDGALKSIKSLIFNFDSLVESGGNVLFVVEGPFDAIKMDFFGQNYGARATCLFSKTATPDQIDLLSELSMVFDLVVVLLDAAEAADIMDLGSSLAFLDDRVVQGELPRGFSDPGELGFRQIRTMTEQYCG